MVVLAALEYQVVGSTLSDSIDFLKFAESTLNVLLSKLHISKIILFENLVQKV